jgi:hypothetical protein
MHILSSLRPALFAINLLVSLSFLLPATGQVPQGFNYQAIARDVSGNPIVNQSLPVMITIQSDSLGGTIFWSELHSSVTTNAYGLFTLVIGKGTKQSGTAAAFSDIDWSVSPKFVKTEVNYSGWKTLGSSRLNAVPYAMMAEEVSGPLKKLSVSGTTTNMEEPLFEVKNTTGQTVFAVYNEGVRVYVDDGAKAAKGGFAVSSFGSAKAPAQEYFVVSADSIRAYIGTNPEKGVKGGFAVSSFNQAKAPVEEYLRITRDSARIYVREPFDKGLKGGFAVGGFSGAKGTDNNYLNITPENSFIGLGAGSSNTTGTYNSFMGYQNGYLNTTGSQNVFIGYESGYLNSTGNANVYIGNNTGYNNPSGIANIYIGTSAGKNSNSGNNNILLGTLAGQKNSADYNIFLGNYSGYNNSTGANNLFAGYFAGASNRKGNSNVYLGLLSGWADTTGSYNVFVGERAGFSNQASNNVMIGYLSGQNSTTGNNNLFLGTETGHNNKGTNNLFLGYQAGYTNSTGISNIFLGFQSGYYNTTGIQNSFFGTQAGFSNTTGYNNIFLGTGAGQFNTEGSNNVFIGMQTGNKNTLGGFNTSLGYLAGFSNQTGNSNIFLGNMAGYYETGSNKLYIENTPSDKNNALVYGEFDTKSFTINGKLGIMKTSPAVKIDVASGNWDVHNGEGDFRIGDGSYRFKIGVANSGGGAGDVRLTSHGGTSRLILGSNGQDVLLVYGTSVMPWNDNLSTLGTSSNRWTTVYAVNGTINTSDARLKTDIANLQYGLESILKLRPVTFRWKNEESSSPHLGLLAQEVAQVITEVVDTGNDNNHTLGINYSELVPVLIKSIQEQYVLIETQNEKIARLEKLVEQLLESR